jgi:hypothetical protein
MSVVEDWKIKQEKFSYQKWSSQMERVLTTLVADDLGGSGQYLDDDIGNEDFNNDVALVVSEMIKSQWDSYNDTIGDTVTEVLGSDFKDTI